MAEKRDGELEQVVLDLDKEELEANESVEKMEDESTLLSKKIESLSEKEFGSTTAVNKPNCGSNTDATTDSALNGVNRMTSKTDSDDDILEIVEVLKPAEIDKGSTTLNTGTTNTQAERLQRIEERKRREFNFRSNRLQQQKKRPRYTQDGKAAIYADDFNFCDCLLPACPGCHFPCRFCDDKRCGHECRVNRRYVYESIEVEGRNTIIRTPKA